AAFGIYAIGMLPCLLLGGVCADRFGPRFIVLTGGIISALGNLLMLFVHEGAWLLAGRFIVGIGVGLVVSAGTAWAGHVRGASGVTLAGIILTLGFAVGPIATSLIGASTAKISLLFYFIVEFSSISLVAGFML